MPRFACRAIATSFIVGVLALPVAGRPAAPPASDVEVRTVHARIESALEQGLPAVGRVVADWRSAEAAVPGLLVADFEQSGFEGFNYGAAIGSFWRWELGQHPSKLYSADVTGYYLDVRLMKPGRSVERGADAARRTSQRLGMQYWLTGTISEESRDRVRIIMDAGRRSDNLRSTESWTGPRANMYEGIRLSCRKVLGALAFPAIDVACSAGSSAGVAELEQLALWYVRTRGLKGDDWRVQARAFYAALPGFGPAQLSMSQTWVTGFYRTEDNDNYDRFLAKHSGNVTLQRWGHHSLVQILETSLDSRHINALSKLVSTAPDNPQTSMDLSSALSGTRYLYMPSRGKAGEMWYIAPSSRDPHPPYLAAAALAAEAVRRWPDNYRVQWALAAAVGTLAANIRGTAFWNDVPADIKRRYTALRSISSEATDRALALHEFAPGLWKLKLDDAGGNSGAMMEVFRRAAELAPNDPSIYTKAMNFAGPQWGGTEEMRNEIHDIARTNNPGAAWIDEMRKAWTKD